MPQERVQAIADELFQEMQRKEDVVAGSQPDWDSPVFSMAQEAASTDTCSELTGVTVDEKVNGNLVAGAPIALPTLPVADMRRLSEVRCTALCLASWRTFALLCSHIGSGACPERCHAWLSMHDHCSRQLLPCNTDCAIDTPVPQVVDRAIYNFHGFCTDSTAVAAAGAADVAGRQRVPWEEPQIRAPAALPVAAGPPDHGDAAAARFGPVGQLSGQLH